MAELANSTAGAVFKLVARTGASSELFDKIRYYRTSCVEADMKRAVFEHEFKRLPKRARVNDVLDHEITEMQAAYNAQLRARNDLLSFIDEAF